MKKLYGNLPTLPLKTDPRLSFRMPEVPLTKSCLEDYSQYDPATNSQCTDASLRALNEQKEAVRGLSLWYTNHLSAMYAIQRHKDFRNEKVRSFAKKLDRQATFELSDPFKLEQQPLGPHIDLENYLNSLKSRQKEMRSFGKRSAVWEKYFEKAIPGWNELKQSKKIYPNLDNTTPKKRSAKVKRKISLNSQHNTEIPYNRQSQTSGLSVLSSIQKPPIPRLSKLKNSQENFGTPVILENKVHDYFLNSAVVKNEQMGNINNEILFNQVYGKYLLKNEKNEINLRKKRKPKSIKKPIDINIAFSKKYKPENKTDHNENNQEALKNIDGLIKSKQTELESLLLDVENSSIKKENLYKIKRKRSKNLHFKLNPIKKTLSDQFIQRRSTTSLMDIPKLSKRKISHKTTHNKMLKSYPKTIAARLDPTVRPNDKRRVSYKTSVVDTVTSKENARTINNVTNGNNNHDEPLFEPTKGDEGVMGNFLNTNQIAKNKSELRNQLIDIVNSVWTSDKKLGGLEALHTYRNPALPLSNSISEPLE